MDDEASSDLQKCLSDGQMDTDEGPLINENSNDLSEAPKTENEPQSEPDLINEIESEAISASSEDVIKHNDITMETTQDNNDELTNDIPEKVNSSGVKKSKLIEKKYLEDKILCNNKLPDMQENVTTGKEVQIGNDSATSKIDIDEKTEEKPQPTKLQPDIEKEENIKVGGAEETEVVSEDELPAVQKPSVKDAENVSDDELPGPKPAELPADTEVVSEDELPASKKESRKRKTGEERDGYDPGSPTSEGESAGKKQAVAKNGESKPVPSEKRSSVDEKPKKKALPELDKYWKVVNDDPTDFTGWTYLLQYVDQESDVEAAREAYDAFLSHYPYCYGYWRKYADYEKRKGSKKKCLEVLERGLKAIPLSVDLWIHYLNHVKSTRTEDHVYIRSQYERAIEACGLEFRSDRLWESYIKWEAENGSALQVTNIYDRLLSTPTLGYTSHFDNFQEHVMSEPVSGAVSRAELVRLRGEVRDSAPTQPPLDLPPGEDEPLDHVASEEEAQAIKERIIAARRKIHKATGEEVAARWTFEEGIKRPYFHVKPLERCQLKNWKAYLEWEKQNGSLKRALVLHERCLIACALYEEFWMRLIKFLEERIPSDPELVAVEREVLERACGVHHLDKPDLHMHWAQFEEAQGNPGRAAEILERIEKTCPNLVQIQYRRINLERRRGDYEKCIQLYEGYISSAKNKSVASAMAIKYARFLFHVKQDKPAARKALNDAIAKDPLNARLHMQRLDLALHTPDTPYEELEELVMSYEKQEGAEVETCAALAVRRRELAEELGPVAAARAAHLHARAAHKHLRKRARANKHDAPPHHQVSTDGSKKKESCTTTPSTATTSSTSTYYQTQAATAQSYDQSYAQPYTPPWGYQQPPGPYQHHPHPWPQYPNYY
ncbi:pre-mRNA-processing factor 39 isoform X3 [Nymphalis io]|uniref:pre-mRNA-processing factor 39 isoform X3 n=1 Tax=Inachis io TaxID=171585 RepID=UPI00216A1D3C|nr:pre-mRNA-processing factor 39 isoform X3 [Nymphalis io]